MDAWVREILSAVRDGRLTPDEAARRLDSGPPAEAGTPEAGTPEAGTADAGTADAGTADAGPSGPNPYPDLQPPASDAAADGRRDVWAAATDPADAAGAGETPTHAADGAPARVVLRASSRSVRVVGDRTIAQVAVDGHHVLRRDGDRLLVTADAGLSEITAGGFAFTQPEAWRSLLATAARAAGSRTTVRVNPDIPVEVEVVAGSATLDAVPRLERLDVTAGSARVDGAEGPLRIAVVGGSLTLAARLVTGASTIRCESGSVRVRLDPASDVRVRGQAQLGAVKLADRAPGEDLVVGGGSASLDIDAVMGSITVEVPQ